MRWLACAPLVFSLIGCAGRPRTLARLDDYDRAYAQHRRKVQGCPQGGPESCCRDLTAQLREAMANDDVARTAHLVDAVALSCKLDARAAEEALDFVSAARKQVDGGGTVNVRYALQVGPEDRVYWASAFLDDRHPVGGTVAPGVHSIDVEVHVLTPADGARNLLFAIQAQDRIEVQAGKNHEVMVTLFRKPGAVEDPFVLTLTVSSLRNDPLPAAAKPGAPAPAIRSLQKSRVKTLAELHVPWELMIGGNRVVAMMLCVDKHGQLTSMKPTASFHPRHQGMALDWMFRSEFEPLVLNDQAYASCFPMRMEFHRKEPSY